VDDLLHEYTGLATLMAYDPFASLQGPLDYRFGSHRLVPRADTDLVP
jgi:hypothetical protein